MGTVTPSKGILVDRVAHASALTLKNFGCIKFLKSLKWNLSPGFIL